MKTRLASLALLAVLAAPLAGCGKEPTAPITPSSQAPAPPPAASLNFDFSFFDRNGGTALAALPAGAEGTQLKSNWINAVTRVVFLNLTVADLFSTPVYALNAALSQTPVLGDDGWFTWTYTVTEQGRTITLRLRGRVDGAIVTWRMYADDSAATPAMSNFLWFTGESRLDNTTGHWIFNDRREAKAVAVARIDWNAASATKRSLAFSNVETGSADMGDRLEYRVDGAIVSVTYHDQSENKDADIRWNETTGTGSLTVPDYNNGQRACWDEHQEDMVCPADPS